MLKQLWLFLLVINLLSNKVLALKPQALIDRLSQLTATYETKVGVAFIDLQSSWTFSIHGSKEFPAASVAKVPVMAAAFHLSDSGKLDLQQRVRFRESDKLEGAGVLRWMKAGQEYTLWNLLRLMITLSDNTATRLAINAIGLPAINAYLQEINLKNTRITDPTMLVEPPAANNNLTTPDDIARLLVRIYNCRGFSKKSSKQMIAWMNYQRYRWGIWRGVPPGTYVANKTGQLEGILNDAGIIYTKKGNYVLSIFTWGFKKQRDARLLINEISRVAYENYTGEKVTRRQSQRRPFVKYRRRWGRHGAVSNRKSRTYLRR